MVGKTSCASGRGNGSEGTRTGYFGCLIDIKPGNTIGANQAEGKNADLEDKGVCFHSSFGYLECVMCDGC